ncbi:MAG TPA: NFACT family protein [Candidatus Ornithomonoglobus merdipullorum]|uniref:Rqc2 homolog RqcH n=1 Tax=Candidatus Ornithomonoglobus merdipullorum TaxID=2840895 RepID=A0A9D1SDU0_9FIRM|nr:NFACT family protein [Candidatus Ornithomonoglobus merdipullorum]
MALDAVAVSALVDELQCLVGGRVDKVHQPERDEIAVYVRTYDSSYRLVLSASSANPRAHLTEHTKKNPATAPLFCMLLRKHIGSGKITAVEQVGFERIIKISVESYNELGDLTVKYLITEIMGRYSNVILVSEDGTVIDSVKHVDGTVSSVREILPGGVYAPPPPQNKVPLTEFGADDTIPFDRPVKADKAILSSVAGISPLTAREIVYSVFGTTDVNAADVNTNKAAELKLAVMKLGERVRNKDFSPCIITDNATGKLMEFSAVDIRQYERLASVQSAGSMNEVVDDFYYRRDMHDRMRQKSAGIVKLLNNNIERVSKKLSILERTVKDAENREEYKIKGDLLTANIYRMQEGMKEIEADNFYEPGSAPMKIALDPSLSPSMNAQRYYKKYNKAKTALVEAAKQIEAARADLDYLESTLYVAENAETIEDIDAVKDEMASLGYISRRSKQTRRKAKEKSKPMHFVSSDGFDIYVGRNNTQNDYLTLKFANTSDLWFHTKDIHGSHAVIKLGLDKDVPKNTILEAARLAAYYSQARESAQVPVDYTVIKNVKKPNGAKPGMVIYEGYNTVYVKPGLITDGEEHDA